RPGSQRGQQRPHVIGIYPDVAEAASFDLAEQLGDAVLENLAADKADVGMQLRLLREMLAAAKPDLQPNVARWRGEQGPRIELPGFRQGEGQQRQQLTLAHLLAGAQRPPAAPAVELFARLGRVGHMHRMRGLYASSGRV